MNHIVTPNPFAKEVMFEALLCKVESDPLIFKGIMRSYGPETFVWDRMNVYEQIEVRTIDTRSNQVVVR